MAANTKTSGTFLNIGAKRRWPEAGAPWMAANTKTFGTFLNSGAKRHWPEGFASGKEARIKKCPEHFLTLERSDDGPQG